jgi:hypothetical protein
MRRFPPPWNVEPLDAGYKVVDANGQVLAYVYGLDDSRDARIAKALTGDEARRIASNIAKLPSLVSDCRFCSLGAVCFFPTIDFGLRDIP